MRHFTLEIMTYLPLNMFQTLSTAPLIEKVWFFLQVKMATLERFERSKKHNKNLIELSFDKGNEIE